MTTKQQRARNPAKGPTHPHRAEADASPQKSGPKLRRLRIRNYRAIDDLTLEIPAPRMAGDPDILVLGSRNGVGKTSVLEAVGLAVYATYKSSSFELAIPGTLMDIMVRAGAEEALIDASFESPGGGSEALRVGFHRETGLIRFSGKRFDAPHLGRFAAPPGHADIRFQALLGHDSEPLLRPPLLYFHSYRKVVEGNVEIGEILGASAAGAREERRDSPAERTPRATSAFKVEILRALMKRAGLFEDTVSASNGDDLEQLNKLTTRFAGGVIERLRPSRDNTIDLRVSPAGGGPSYSFDALSSGQKEIIATLFLVWKHTRAQPSVVLIDEPELHLNAEWHRSFVWALRELSGDNQYILATHSEDIFASVDEERRVLLSSTLPAAES